MSKNTGFFLFPDKLCKSAYEIDYKAMYDKGFKGIIFDIDNTLVKHDAPATADAARLFKKLHDMGFKTVIVSNNEQERVMKFAKAVHSPYIHKAHKPMTVGYEKAMEMMKTTKRNTFSVGDQLLTDVWGTNNAGIYCVLTKPLNKKEPPHIILKRGLEAPFLLAYKIKNMKKSR